MKNWTDHGKKLLVPLIMAAMLLGLLVSCTSGAELSAALGGSDQSTQQEADTTATVSTLEDRLVQASTDVRSSVVSIRTGQGEGSGLIYDSSGLILTNSHVVQDAEKIIATLPNGEHFEGEVLASSQEFELAVVKIDGDDLPAAPLGDSSALEPGQFAIAIGNPYGYDYTVTTGVISAVGRAVSLGEGSYTQPMIQTDAAINPGNSGGPLIDLNGNVVGITTSIAAPQGYPAQGLGFAIPVDTVKRIAPQLVEYGKVIDSGQPYLGVMLSDLPESAFSQYDWFGQPQSKTDYGTDHGALVREVEQGSPAAEAGIEADDVIVSFDGHEIYTLDEFMQYIVDNSPGEEVTLELVRDGEKTEISLALGEAPVRE